MKCEFEDSLLSSGSIMRKTSSFFTENAGKAIAVITGVVATLLSFTEIGFYGIQTAEFTTNLAVMLLSSYIIFFSLEDAGERLGKLSKEYISTAEEHRALVSQIKGKDIPSLREFCMSYKRRELEYRQENILLSAALTRDDLSGFLEGKEYSARHAKILKRVHRMTPLTLTADMLIDSNAGKEGGELKNPEKGKAVRMFLQMLPSALCTVFTVSVMLSGKDGLTAAAVIESLLKLSCLPIIGLRAYAQGYAYVTESLTPWIKTKSRLLEAFIDS